VDLPESRAALAGVEDQKHEEGGGDNGNDDEDQGRTGEARSLLRWWNGRFHLRLDAGWDWPVVFGETAAVGRANAAGLVGIHAKSTARKRGQMAHRKSR